MQHMWCRSIIDDDIRRLPVLVLLPQLVPAAGAELAYLPAAAGAQSPAG
jgi:hypothetical protein